MNNQFLGSRAKRRPFEVWGSSQKRSAAVRHEVTTAGEAASAFFKQERGAEEEEEACFVAEVAEPGKKRKRPIKFANPRGVSRGD